MVKKFSMLALAGLIALPALASASAGPNPTDLERKIEELSLQLDQLKAAMAKQDESLTDLSDTVDGLDERSEAWDLSSRFTFYGDFRSRLDYYSADTVGGDTFENDTAWSNRFRLNMRVAATENVEFKGRLAMYKAWGMQTTPEGYAGGWPMFDGMATRTPGDSALYVDRAFVNWNNIGGNPIWFSIGRRPTTDGAPNHIRMGADTRMATPTAYMDWPFDGISAGYAYRWANENMGTGRVRICYGRGFENGLLEENNTLEDNDFVGLSWDIMKKGDRFAYLQSFMAFDVFNFPAFNDASANAQYEAMMTAFAGGPLGRTNVGDILHTSGLYQDKIGNLTYHATVGWSQTNPNGQGLGMLGSTTDDKDGFSYIIGARYDMDDMGLKLGAEYNWGSEYWVSMSPGHDDLYMSKLATRGNVIELYGIYDIPAGAAISKFGSAFIRFGYQHYEYDYSGSSDWNMTPIDLSNAAAVAAMDDAYSALLGSSFDPIESADQIYVTFEATF